MKQLSEFKNEDGVVVVAKLLNPIAQICSKMKKAEGSPVEFLTKALEDSPKEVMKIFAILNEVPEDEYECNAATILINTLKLASDKEFMSLFGLQSQTPTSSGSVSGNTEDQQT